MTIGLTYGDDSGKFEKNSCFSLVQEKVRVVLSLEKRAVETVGFLSSSKKECRQETESEVIRFYWG